MRWLERAREFLSPPPFTSFSEFGGLVAVKEPEPVLIQDFVAPQPAQAIFALPEPITGSQLVGTAGIWLCPTTPGIRCFCLGDLAEPE